MLSTGMPSVTLISAYGTGGCAMSKASSCWQDGGQVAERRAQRRVALGHKQFLFGCPDLPGRDVPGMQGLPASVRSVRGAPDTPAFLLIAGGEPAGDRGRIADCRKLVHELLPDSLPDVGSVGAAQPASAADGPDERGVPVDECVPRLFVAVSGAPHKVGDGQVIVHRVSILSGQRTGHRGWCAGTARPPTGIVTAS